MQSELIKVQMKGECRQYNRLLLAVHRTYVGKMATKCRTHDCVARSMLKSTVKRFLAAVCCGLPSTGV